MRPSMSSVGGKDDGEDLHSFAEGGSGGQCPHGCLVGLGEACEPTPPSIDESRHSSEQVGASARAGASLYCCGDDRVQGFRELLMDAGEALAGRPG